MKKTVCKKLRAAVSHLPEMEYPYNKVQLVKMEQELGADAPFYLKKIKSSRAANVYRRYKRAYNRGEQHSMMQFLNNVADGSHQSKKLAVAR